MTNSDIKELLKTSEYGFLREKDILGDNIIMLCLGGSRAYGISTPSSDIDIRGIALNGVKQIYGLESDFGTFTNKHTDTVVYSLKKITSLLLSCNPSALEILGCRPEDYLYINKYGKRFLDEKEAFLSKEANPRIKGYYKQQLSNLEAYLINNGTSNKTEVERMGDSLQRVIDAFNMKHSMSDLDLKIRVISKYKDKELWDSMKHNEKAENFGQDLVMSGSLLDYPMNDLKTILSEMHKTQSDFGKIAKEGAVRQGIKISKSMVSAVRGLLVGIWLNRYGEVKTHWEGEQRDLLMDIRLDKYLKDDMVSVRPEFFELVDELEKEYREALENTVLKDEPDFEAINQMLLDISRDAYK